MGIAHGKIITRSKGLKSRYTIAIGIANEIEKNSKKITTKAPNVFGMLCVMDRREKTLSAIPNFY